MVRIACVYERLAKATAPFIEQKPVIVRALRSKREQITGDLVQESQLEALLKAACGQEGLEWPLCEPTE